jgi:hypothetical protein
VGVSLALYLIAPYWNMPRKEGGVWFFNPVAWQFLFILGGALALYGQDNPAVDHRPLSRQPLFLGAVVYLLVTGLVAVSWKWPPARRGHARGVRRVGVPHQQDQLVTCASVALLALVYVVAKIVPHGQWLNQWFARQVCRMGRYSLEVFCLG